MPLARLRRLRVRAGVRTASALHGASDRIERRVTTGGLAWIFSAPRSGTTWLLSLLGAHPKVVAVNEPLIGAHLGVVQGHVAPGVDDPDRLVYDAMRTNPNYVFADGTDWIEAMASMMRRRFLLPHAELLSAGGRVVLKEPHGTEAAPLLQRLVPDSRIIVLVRDPRDCLDSIVDIVEEGWMGAPGQGPLERDARRELLEQNAAQWRLRLNSSLEVHDRLPAEQRVLVRYEDLRAATSVELARVFAFLGLEATPQWIDGTVEGLAFENISPENRGPGRFHRAASPGLWRERFHPDDVEWATDYFADELDRFGYAR